MFPHFLNKLFLLIIKIIQIILNPNFETKFFNKNLLYPNNAFLNKTLSYRNVMFFLQINYAQRLICEYHFKVRDY